MKNLINYTEEAIYRVERPNDVGHLINNASMRLKNPMMVFYMTDVSDECRRQIVADFDNLFIVDKKNVPFISEANDDEIANVARSIMEEGKFQDYNYSLMYFIVDTKSLNSSSSFEVLIENMQKVKESLSGFSDWKCILFLLLDESNGIRDSIALSVRKKLAEMFGSESPLDLCVVVSNRLKNNSIIRDDRIRICEFITTVILTNVGEAQLPIHSGYNVLTLSTLNERKPYKEISKTIVKTLFNRIQQYVLRQTPKFDESKYLEKIGINHTSKYFNVFEKDIPKNVISDIELSYMPVSTDNSKLMFDSYEDFNKQTFGCLDGVLKERVNSSTYLTEAKIRLLKDKYKEELKTNCSILDFYLVGQNFSLLKSLYLSGIGEVSNIGTSVSTKFKSKYMASISQSERFYSELFNELKHYTTEAIEYRKELTSMFEEAASLRVDAEVSSYYEKLVINYLEQNRKEFELLFSLNSDSVSDSFNSRIKRLIDGIVSSETVFAKPYMQELETRLKAVDVGKSLLEVVNDKLINADSRMFFYPLLIGGGLKEIKSNPILLLDFYEDIPLDSFKDDFIPIDIENKSFIEKVSIYRLEALNLYSE